VWRWNRGCYGITDGVPHLRIENRVLPSGPSVADEIANTALWLGLMTAIGAKHPEVNRMLPFESVRANFVSAARQGLVAHLTWLDGEEHPAAALALDVLLPLAAEGLAATGIDDGEATRYLEIVERRVRSGHTGGRWTLNSLDAMRHQGSPGQRLNSLTAAMASRQRAGQPVADWTLASLDEGGQWRHNFVTVEQLMTTDLVTVDEDDPVELAANLMDWHKIRQVLVEDHDHQLVGLVSYRTILRLVAGPSVDLGAIGVIDVMKRDPVSVPPDMAPLRALELMRSFGIGALPVVVDRQLVGIVTEHDFFNVAGMLLLEQIESH
jgi:CBS domain-containing protein